MRRPDIVDEPVFDALSIGTRRLQSDARQSHRTANTVPGSAPPQEVRAIRSENRALRTHTGFRDAKSGPRIHAVLDRETEHEDAPSAAARRSSARACQTREILAVRQSNGAHAEADGCSQRQAK